MLRWNRQLSSGGEIQAQAYYDRIERDDRASGGGKFSTNTYDAEIQHNFTAGAHSIVWGGGARTAAGGSARVETGPGGAGLGIGRACVAIAYAVR